MSLLFQGFYTEWNNSSQGLGVCVCVCVCVHSATQPCLTLCNLIECSPPGSSVHEIFQARILEWAVISSSRGSSQPRDQTHISCVSCLVGGFLITSTTWEALTWSINGTSTIVVCRCFSSPFLPSLQQLTTFSFSTFLLSFRPRPSAFLFQLFVHKILFLFSINFTIITHVPFWTSSFHHIIPHYIVFALYLIQIHRLFKKKTICKYLPKWYLLFFPTV